MNNREHVIGVNLSILQLFFQFVLGRKQKTGAEWVSRMIVEAKLK